MLKMICAVVQEENEEEKGNKVSGQEEGGGGGGWGGISMLIDSSRAWLARLDSTELASHDTSPCFPWQSFCWSTGPRSKPPPLHRLCPLPERLHQYQERLVSPRGTMWWWRDRGHSANCQGCRSVFFFFIGGGGVFLGSGGLVFRLLHNCDGLYLEGQSFFFFSLVSPSFSLSSA